MATQYSLTNAFAAITEESGTIQNIGYESVELVSTSNAVEGEGIILLPGEKKAFKGAIKARSLGATNKVNVVDFKEGVGGGDDVMTGASESADGKAGLVPTPTAGNENRFLRGDGAWAVPTDEDTQYQPATTLTDGLMSSADKTFVEGEKENYRQPSTTYAVGNIAYHSALPTGWYLECTTAGISDSGDLTISSIAVGGTVTDGTVVWTIQRSYIVKNYSFVASLNFGTSGKSKITMCGSHPNTEGKPPTDYANVLSFWEEDIGNYQIACGSNGDTYTRTYNTTLASWFSWRQQEAIVAKSLGANGYIKYASGLIVQWGDGAYIGTSKTNVIFPISFTQQDYSVIITSKKANASDTGNRYAWVDNVRPFAGFDAYASSAGYFFYIAIGH